MNKDTNIAFTQIDLERYRTPNSKLFTGRDRGEQVRDQSRIDEIETQNGNIEIVIPPDIYSITPSFFEEFLYNVVKKLGEDGFHNRFRFKNEGEYKIEEDLVKGIRRILRRKNAL